MTHTRRPILPILVSFMLFLHVHAQKYMIENGDTVPFQLRMEIYTDTFFLPDHTYYPGDTGYTAACQTFEILDGKILNITNEDCLRQGFWRVEDSLGQYATGYYEDGNETGVWSYYDQQGTLLRTEEKTILDDKSHTLQITEYQNGVAKNLRNPFLALLQKYAFTLLLLFAALSFIRWFLNSRIYNLENNTRHPPFYFYFPGFIIGSREHSIASMFSLWFLQYKPVVRNLARLSNALFLLQVLTLVLMIVGMVTMEHA